MGHALKKLIVDGETHKLTNDYSVIYGRVKNKPQEHAGGLLSHTLWLRESILGKIGLELNNNHQ